MIYILTDGCYSDYHIVAATTDKEKAEELSAKLYCEVEEYEDLKIDIKDREVYIVCMQKNGNTDSVSIDNLVISASEWTYHFDNKGRLVNTCWAKDATHAVKITNELRTRLIAEGNFK